MKPIVRVSIIASVLVALTGCTRPESATRVLLDAGYSDVQITGYRFFVCSENDTMHTGFRAKGPTGRPVTGTVCEGVMFKASTIRLD